MEDYANSESQNKGSSELIDLTVNISPESRTWPGDKHPEFKQMATLVGDEVNISRLNMNLHTGTHIDAPSHFVADGATIDEIPLERCHGRAVVYRSPEKPQGGVIGLEELKASGITFNEDDILIVDSGIRELRGDDRYYEDFPVPSAALLKWLLTKGIKCYGTDCPSIDPLGSESHENHKLLLRQEIPIVENLTNLDGLNEFEELTFSAFPLKLKALEASPCRAVAMTGSESTEVEVMDE